MEFALIIFNGLLLRLIYFWSPYIDFHADKTPLLLFTLIIFPLTVWQSLKLGQKLFPSKAVFLPLLIAINPLFISLSFNSFLIPIGLSLFILTLNLSINFYQQKNKYYLIAGFILLFVSLGLLFREVNNLNLPLFHFVKDPGVINAINASRGTELENHNPIRAKILYNKTFFGFYWLKLFVQQFSLSNIFGLTESINSFSTLNTLPLLIILAPFFIIGFLKSFTLFDKLKRWLILSAMIVPAIFSSLVEFDPLFFSYSLFIILVYSVLGIKLCLKTKQKFSIFSILLLINLFLTYVHLWSGVKF